MTAPPATHIRSFMSGALKYIYRFPVKGLSGERLTHSVLAVGEGLPHDRRFAIAWGQDRDLAQGAQWMPRRNFATLAEAEKLAWLEAAFDPGSGRLCLLRKGRVVVQGAITTTIGRTLIDQFLAAFPGLKSAAKGGKPPKLVEAGKGGHFTNLREAPLSVVNLASIDALTRAAGHEVDPRRFRANLYLEGFEAWEERDWTGRDLVLRPPEGEAGTPVRLHLTAPLPRCAGVEISPTGTRKAGESDLPLLPLLRRATGQKNFGVMAEVASGGTIGEGWQAAIETGEGEPTPS